MACHGTSTIVVTAGQAAAAIGHPVAATGAASGQTGTLQSGEQMAQALLAGEFSSLPLFQLNGLASFGPTTGATKIISSP